MKAYTVGLQLGKKLNRPVVYDSTDRFTMVREIIGVIVSEVFYACIETTTKLKDVGRWLNHILMWSEWGFVAVQTSKPIP